MTDTFEAVIGLEVHVQLRTRTKLFCACEVEFGADPNSHICPVCAGHPGTLPVLNERALALGIQAGLALHCTVAPRTSFDRKNYFYPDLPKGYQITQLAEPLNRDGYLEVSDDAFVVRPVRIVRAHLEEDAGKLIHPTDADHSLVDLNRAGVPLLEIVSAPDLRSPSDARRYLEELRRRLRYAGVSDCDMEKGTLRCDANISIREIGSTDLNARVEIKNLNSFRNVERALQFEFQRQTGVVAAGGRVEQETRGFSEDEGVTVPQRGKEDLHDYRYFPEPDLPPVVVSEDLLAELRRALPEMPDQKRARYASEYGLRPDEIELLVSEPEYADYFERCVDAGAGPRDAARYFSSVVLAASNERSVSVADLSLSPAHVAEVARMQREGRLSNQAARKILAHIVESGDDPESAVRRLGLEQVSDREQLEKVVALVIESQSRAVEEYRAGKTAALNALVGAVMKASGGKANPNLARQILEERLSS